MNTCKYCGMNAEKDHATYATCVGALLEHVKKLEKVRSAAVDLLEIVRLVGVGDWHFPVYAEALKKTLEECP